MLMEVPLSAIPHQLVAVVVGNQAFQFEIRQMGSSIFSSVIVDGNQITRNVRATNGGELFPWPDQRVGTQFYWEDSQGDEPPQYEGLGSRWHLTYEVDDE